MFELEIKGQVYQFCFGMGFLREINKRINQPVDGLKDVKKDVGLGYYVLLLIDRDVEALVDVLFAANKGFDRRVTTVLLDSYIDDADTDIEGLFVTVLDFLKQANATKKKTMELVEMAEKEAEKAKAAQTAQ